MKINLIPNNDQRNRGRPHHNEAQQSEDSTTDHHPQQIAAASLGRTDTSELSAITLPSVSDISNTGALHRGGGGGSGDVRYESIGEIDVESSGEPEPLVTPSSNKANNDEKATKQINNPHPDAHALHEEAMATARQERSVSSLPSLATTPHRVDDEGQSLLHRGGKDNPVYQSFGTMEDVSGASSFVVGADRPLLPNKPSTPPLENKKSVGFSGLPTTTTTTTHHEKAQRRKSIRFSMLGNAFATMLGLNSSSFDSDEDENVAGDEEMPADTAREEERNRKRGWSIVRNRQKSIILYGRRILEQDSNDDEENFGLDGTEDDAIFFSERSAQRRESDRKARQRQKLLDRANKAQERYEITIADCVVAIACYLGLSVLAFSLIFEDWTLIDSAYFAVVTFTACGYGDLVPSTGGGRIFCTLFALGGCAFLGIALGIIGDKMVKQEVENRKKLEAVRQSTVMKSFATQESSAESEGSYFRGSLKDSLGTATNNISLSIKLPALIFIVSCSTFISMREGWTFFDGLYYTIITMCTIGYGDFTPTSESTRATAVIFVPFSVACLGTILARIASAVINKRQQKFRDDLLHFELTPDMFEACDVSNDGRVDRGEYMAFMLLAMKAVDGELLDAINAQFDKLDVTKSGDLCVDDLLGALERNLHSAKTKLELHRYKQSLLAKGTRKRGLRNSMLFGSDGVEGKD